MEAEQSDFDFPKARKALVDSFANAVAIRFDSEDYAESLRKVEAEREERRKRANFRNKEFKRWFFEKISESVVLMEDEENEKH